MFHEPRRALVGVGLTLAGVTVAGVALAGSKALGGLAGGGLLVVAVAGYVTAVIGVLAAGYILMYPLLLLIAPFAVLSHLLLLPLRQRAGAVYHNGHKRGEKVVAWRSAHDRVVVVRLFKRISLEGVDYEP